MCTHTPAAQVQHSNLVPGHAAPHASASVCAGGALRGQLQAADEALQCKAERCAARQVEWADGPLVQAMKAGEALLIDELNLAEDAVLERLNR